MKLTVKTAIRQNKLAKLAKHESMGKGQNNRKTAEQNEARFEAQYKPKANCIQAIYNSENGCYEERQ